MGIKAFSGTRHAHGCTRCATRYEDACTTPGTDGLCITCRGGRGWALLIQGMEPAPCCTECAVVATKDDRQTYRLVGSRVWFLCKSCARTFPYDPITRYQRNQREGKP